MEDTPQPFPLHFKQLHVAFDLFPTFILCAYLNKLNVPQYMSLATALRLRLTQEPLSDHGCIPKSISI
eukprot:523936-Amphidinium_carterae.1